MRVNRREFVFLTVAAAVGCQSGGGGDDATGSMIVPAVIDAGPLSQYATDGVYDQFRDRGFFIVRQGNRLAALSSICTHRDCLLRAKPDDSFACRCHGSTFDPQGHVTRGPARRDLPEYPTSVNEASHLIVRVLASTA